MVGAIGTMPRIAAEAVSKIGRNRCAVASTTASQGCRPCAFSSSTWWMRITELRAIMPVRASTPSSATKPHGLVRKEQSPDDPNQAQRGHAEHQEQAVEALELDHHHREDQNEHQRQSGGDRILRLAALLD